MTVKLRASNCFAGVERQAIQVVDRRQPLLIGDAPLASSALPDVELPGGDARAIAVLDERVDRQAVAVARQRAGADRCRSRSWTTTRVAPGRNSSRGECVGAVAIAGVGSSSSEVRRPRRRSDDRLLEAAAAARGCRIVVCRSRSDRGRRAAADRPADSADADRPARRRRRAMRASSRHEPSG